MDRVRERPHTKFRSLALLGGTFSEAVDAVVVDCAGPKLREVERVRERPHI